MEGLIDGRIRLPRLRCDILIAIRLQLRPAQLLAEFRVVVERGVVGVDVRDHVLVAVEEVQSPGVGLRRLTRQANHNIGDEGRAGGSDLRYRVVNQFLVRGLLYTLEDVVVVGLHTHLDIGDVAFP